jgi:serine/threonine protein kinase
MSVRFSSRSCSTALKTDNIFITRDGVIKILDFGVATATGPSNRSLSDDDATRLPLPVDDSVVGTAGARADRPALSRDGPAR